MEQKNINLRMAHDVPIQKTVVKEKIQIDEDTSFDIYFDIYHIDIDDYLYIKLIENSAISPFYYNKSFTLEDLRERHRIFNAVNIDQVKEALKKSFQFNKIKLVYDPESDGILIKLKAYLFCDEYTIDLPLCKEMIPKSERDDKLLTLYNINKNQIKIGKEIYSYLKSNPGNFDRNLLNILKENFDIIDNSDDNNSEAEQINLDFKKIFNKKKKAFFKKEKQNNEDYMGEVEIKNKTHFTWPKNSFEFKIDKNASDILCKNINYPIYEIVPEASGGFFFFFDAKIEPKEYTCFFDVYFNGKLLKGTQLQLKIVIPQIKL